MKTACLVFFAAALALIAPATSASAGPSVAAGVRHMVVLTDAGTVWAWGMNSAGQVGDGTNTDRIVPTQIMSISGVIAIAAGDSSTYALKSDGTVYAWGYNLYGQIGDGTTTARNAPVAVSGLSSIVAIAAGGAHALALKSDGTLWAWGYNGDGEIGDGTTTHRSTPVQVTSLSTTVTLIGAHGTNSHAMKTDGTVWSWGYNGDGEVGDATSTSPRTSPVQTSGLSSVIDLGGGGTTSYAVNGSGIGKAWGFGSDGELGNGTTSFRQTTPVSVSNLTSLATIRGGNAHAIGAKSDGAVWTWGYNGQGQLGDGTTTMRTTAVQPSGPASVVAVAGGGYSSIAVSSDGRVWTWGYNFYGQLGDGTYVQRKVPVQISDPGFSWRVATPQLSPNGGAFTNNVTVTLTCATPSATIHYTTNGVDPTESDPGVSSGGTVSITQTAMLKAKSWVAGSAASSIESATYTLTAAAPSFSPGAGTYTSAVNVTLSSSSSGATIRYTTDGSTPTGTSTVYSSPIAANTGTTIKAIAEKSGWTTSGGSSAAYTFNYGTLAAPTFTPVPAQVGYGTQVSVSAAAGATIRYTTNGSTPTTSSTVYSSPLTVTGTVTILAKAFHPDWTTSAQSGGAYTVKVSTPVLSPAAGTYSPGQAVTVSDATPSAVIHYTTNGADPTTSDPIIASGATLVAGNFTLKARAFIAGWTSSDLTAAAYVLSGPFTSYALAAGDYHTVGLKNDGTVWTWGYNTTGQLGDPAVAGAGRSLAGVVNGVSGIIAVAAGTQHTLALRSDGTVLAWGDNSVGQLGDNTTTGRSTFAVIAGLSSVTAIAAGSNFSVALESNGTVWAWGSNASGQLGDGTQTQRLVPTQVPSFTNVAAIAAGDAHTVVRKSDGTVWAWGSNQLNQLGDGTQTSHSSPVQVAGLTASAGPWAGFAHSLIATSGGSLYAWGWNTYGQAGGTSSAATPRVVPGLTNGTTADGSTTSIVRASDGTVWTFGKNTSGQIGDGTTGNGSPTPYQVSGVSDVSAVAAGLNHNVVVTSDGSVWAWGANGQGQLGDGTLADRLTPTRISEANFNWKTSTPRLLPAGGIYTAEASVTVTAVSDGADIHYTTNGSDPTQTDPSVTSGNTIVIDQSGTLKATAWSAGAPVSNVAAAVYTMTLPAPTVSPATGIYSGTQTVTMSLTVTGTTIRYTTDGSVPTVSSTAYGSALTIDVTTTVTAKAFKSGWTDSATTARIYTLQAATPTFSPVGGGYGSAQTVTISTSTPSSTIHYTTNGTEPTLTSPVYAAPITVSATGSVKAIASRFGWLDSTSGAASFWITQGTVATPTFTPAAGSYTAPAFVVIATATPGATLRYTVDGRDPTPLSPAYQWPIRVDATTTVKARAFKDSFTPSAVGSAGYALDAAGAVDTPVIAPGGGVFAAGLTAAVTVQASGATLRYTTTGIDPVVTDAVVPSGGIPVDRSMVVKVTGWSATADPSAVRRADFVITGAVWAAGSTSHALKADGTVWSWGAGGWGQIGNGTQNNYSAPVVASGLGGVVAIASSIEHTLAVTADGTVWSWGRNSSYQLGDTSSFRTTPAAVSFPAGVHLIAVAAGSTHSVALRDDGTVWTWGGNANGQLGDGTTTSRSTPAMVAGLNGVTRIAAGAAFTMAIQSDGTTGGRIWAWGDNAYGALGDGSRLTRLTPVQTNAVDSAVAIAAGPDFAVAAMADGSAWSWGHNDSGQLGDTTFTDRLVPVRVAPLAGVFAVAAGRWHAAAVTDDGRVWAWGSDTWLQLADGSGLSHPFPQPVVGVTGALAITAGDLYSLVVQPDGAVMGWGTNSSYQLGDGSAAPRPTPVSVSGLSLATNTWLTGDPDADSLLTWREYLIGTDPLNADSTGSGVGDRVLVAAGYRAANTDVDGDGLSNAAEIALGTDPFNADSDGDTVADAVDCFPLDPARSACLVSNPNDHTPPVITLIEPTTARRIP